MRFVFNDGGRAAAGFKGKEMFESTEPAIQKLYADKVVPQAQEIEQVVEWTAPKWFYEELKVDKIKSARRSV